MTTPRSASLQDPHLGISPRRGAGRASRRDDGLTQTELAEAMGVKRSVIARMESGERPLRFAEFMVLARVFKLTPEALLARVLKW